MPKTTLWPFLALVWLIFAFSSASVDETYPFNISYSPFGTNSPSVVFGFENIADLGHKCGTSLAILPIKLLADVIPEIDGVESPNYVQIIVNKGEPLNLPIVIKEVDGEKTTEQIPIGMDVSTAEEFTIRVILQIATAPVIFDLPFGLICTASDVRYYSAAVPSADASESLINGWSFDYSKVDGADPSSRERQFSTTFTTIDELTTLVMTTHDADYNAKGPLHPVPASDGRCKMQETDHPETPAVFIGFTIDPTHRSITFDLSASPAKATTQYTIHHCTAHIMPQNDRQWLQPLRWSAALNGPFELMPLDQVYRVTSIITPRFGPETFPFAFKYSPTFRPLASSFRFIVGNLKDVFVADKFLGLGQMILPVIPAPANPTMPDMHRYTVIVKQEGEATRLTPHRFDLRIQGNTILAQPLNISWKDDLGPNPIVSVEIEFYIQIQGISTTQTTLPFVLTFGEAGPEDSQIPPTEPHFEPVNDEFAEWTITYELPPKEPDWSQSRLFNMAFTVGDSDIKDDLMFVAYAVGYQTGDGMIFDTKSGEKCEVTKQGDTTPTKVSVNVSQNTLLTIKFSQAPLTKNTAYTLKCPFIQLQPQFWQQFVQKLRWSVISSLAPTWIELSQFADFHSSSIEVAPMGFAPIEHPFSIEYTPFASPYSPTVAFAFGNIAPLAKECSTLSVMRIAVSKFDISSKLNFGQLVVVDKDDKTVRTEIKLAVTTVVPDDVYTIDTFAITGTALETAKSITVEFHFFSTKFLNSPLTFPFQLFCSESKKTYKPAGAPPSFEKSHAELSGWSVTYSIPPGEEAMSQKRNFEMVFTTSDLVLNYPVIVKFSTLDNSQAGPFQRIEGKELHCLVEEQPGSPAVTIPLELSADKLSFLLNFTGSNLPSNTAYKLHSCGIWIIPATADQFTKRSRWTAYSTTVPAFIPLPSTDEYKVSSIDVVAMNAVTPGDQEYNFHHKVSSAIAKYMDLVEIELVSVPSTTVKLETFDFTFDLKGSARLRSGKGNFVAKTVCYNADREETSTSELTVGFAIEQTAVVDGKFVISKVQFTTCSDGPAGVSTLKESSAVLTFPIDEMLTDKLQADYFALHLESTTRYTTQNILTAAPNASLIRPGTAISMKNVPSKGDPIPKDLHPYYATFTPITIEKTALDLANQSIILSSNATARTDLKPNSFFEYFQQGGDASCNFGDFGKLTPDVDQNGTQLTFRLYALEKRIPADASVNIDCPNWFIHLTDTTRVSPLSYSLVTRFESGPASMSAEDEFDLFTDDDLRDNQRPIITWVQPAIFTGPPTPDDDSTPEKKGHGAVIAIVTILILTVIAGGVFILYKKDKLNCCFKRSGESGRLLPSDRSYEQIQ